MDINMFLKNNKLFGEIFRYGLIGTLCACADGGLFYVLRKNELNLYVANFISVNLGIIMAFTLNAFFNFKIKDNLLHRAAKFFCVDYCGLVLSMLIMYFGVTQMEMKEIVVKIISIFFVAIFQFSLNKLFTFRIVKKENL